MFLFSTHTTRTLVKSLSEKWSLWKLMWVCANVGYIMCENMSAFLICCLVDCMIYFIFNMISYCFTYINMYEIDKFESIIKCEFWSVKMCLMVEGTNGFMIGQHYQ